MKTHILMHVNQSEFQNSVKPSCLSRINLGIIYQEVNSILNHNINSQTESKIHLQD